MKMQFETTKIWNLFHFADVMNTLFCLCPILLTEIRKPKSVYFHQDISGVTFGLSLTLKKGSQLPAFSTHFSLL